MTVYTQVAASIAVDTFELAGQANTLEYTVSADEKDATTFTCGGWRAKVPGLAMSMLKVGGFKDWATTGEDQAFPITGLGGASIQTVTLGAGSAVVAGDRAFMSSGRLLGDTDDLKIGELGAFEYNWAGDGRTVSGQNLHPTFARTASGSGTALAFTTPTATQSLYATFHVLSVTGAGTITFTVQTDDNVGFSSSTTRITSSAFAAIGRQFTSLAGALAGESFVRLGYVISGFTSVTFTAAAGVASTSTL